MSALAAGRPARSVLWAVVLMTLAALAARWLCLDRLLPGSVEPDAFHVLHLQSLRGDPALRQHQMFSERYPDLLPRLLAPLPHGPAQAGWATLADERAHLDAAGAPYREVRTAGLLVSILAIPATWLAARAFLAERAALLAAWFSATSLLAFAFSTQARPHAPQAALAILSVALSLRVARRAAPGLVLGAALAATLALALLQNGAFTLPPLALALLLAPGSARARWLRAVLVPCACAAAAFQFYPFAPRIDAGGIHLAGQGGHQLATGLLDGSGFAKTIGWLRDYDPLVLGLATVGLLAALLRLARGWRDVDRPAWHAGAIAATYVVPYVLVIGVNGENYERFVLPLVPWAALLAAHGLSEILAWTREWAATRSMSLALALVCVVFPAWADLRFVRLARAPDTLEQAAAWLRARVGETRASILVSPGLTLPILHEAQAIDAAALDASATATAWVMYQKGYGLRPEPPLALAIRYVPRDLALARPEEAAERAQAVLAQERPDYVVLERSAKHASLPGMVSLAARVEATAERVFVSDGDDPRALRGMRIDYQGADDFLARLFATRAFGPRIEIWKTRR